MTTSRTAIVALMAVLLLAAAADDPSPTRGPDVIKGIWAVESLTYDGMQVPDDPTAGAQLTAFDGKKYMQRQGGKITEEGNYEVDDSKTPGTIDFNITAGPDAGKRQLGIYELHGSLLRIAVSAPGATKRPRSFEAQGALVVVNKRFRP